MAFDFSLDKKKLSRSLSHSCISPNAYARVRLSPLWYSCWMEETMHYNVLRAPVVISLMLNLLFLCNIVRVLFMKLRAPAGPQGGAPSRNILQAFRYVVKHFDSFIRCHFHSIILNQHLFWYQERGPKALCYKLTGLFQRNAVNNINWPDAIKWIFQSHGCANSMI